MSLGWTEFFNTDTKKKNTDRLDFVKIKNICTSEDTTKRRRYLYTCAYSIIHHSHEVEAPKWPLTDECIKKMG